MMAGKADTVFNVHARGTDVTCSGGNKVLHKAWLVDSCDGRQHRLVNMPLLQCCDGLGSVTSTFRVGYGADNKNHHAIVALALKAYVSDT